MPKFAVVTGASSGIGAEFARQLSARGYNLMLVARRADRLQALSNSLTTECEIFTADLARKSECLRLADALADRRIDLFINNAGFGDCGPFLQTDLEKELQRTGVSMETVLARYNLSDISQMLPEHYRDAMSGLRKSKPVAA